MYGEFEAAQSLSFARLPAVVVKGVVVEHDLELIGSARVVQKRRGKLLALLAESLRNYNGMVENIPSKRRTILDILVE